MQFKKLLPLVAKYDKNVTLEELFEVWGNLDEEKKQFMIDSMMVIENKDEYDVGASAASYVNISQFAKTTVEYRKQNEFIKVLQDEKSNISVDKKGNLVIT